MENESYYRFDPTGIYRVQLVSRRVQTGDQFLLAAIENKPMILRDVVSPSPHPRLGPVGMAIFKDTILTWARVIRLRLYTWWKVETPPRSGESQPPVLVPTFLTDEGTLMEMEWTPPMPVVFAVLQRTTLEPLCSFLMAIDSQGRKYRLPFSNIYDDCKVCLNATIQPQPTSVELLSWTFGVLESSPWGGDLFPTDRHGKVAAIIRFSSGKEQLGMTTEKWEDLCLLCANAYLNAIELNSMVVKQKRKP